MSRSVHRKWDKEWREAADERAARLAALDELRAAEALAHVTERQFLRTHCRKCRGYLSPFTVEHIGATFLPKGGCCGRCHYTGLVTQEMPA